MDSESDELCDATLRARPSRSPPLIAIILCCNFRTFGDPRVYKTIRHGLIDSLGSNVTTFVYGKLEHSHKPTSSFGPEVPTSDEEVASEKQRVGRSLEYLRANGRALEVHMEPRAASSIEPACPMWNSTTMPWIRKAYSGQMHSHYHAFRLVEAYEVRHGVSFEWIVRARLDALWLHPVAPWCTYRPGTAYTAWPAPVDWFLMLPRSVASKVMLRPYQHYRQCGQTGMNRIRLAAAVVGPRRPSWARSCRRACRWWAPSTTAASGAAPLRARRSRSCGTRSWCG